MTDDASDADPIRLKSASGLSAEVNANGSLRRFDCGAISLALFVGSEIEGGPANLYLRRRAARSEWTPLLGPRSPTIFAQEPSGSRLLGCGEWLGIRYTLALLLAQAVPAWFWQLTLENGTADTQRLDLTYAQDVALAPYGAVRMNEYYVSQYIDHTPLRHEAHGWVLTARQNQAVDGRNPWCQIGSLRHGASFATDAMQLHGLAARAGSSPPGLVTDLPGRRLQHEHSMAIVRDAPLELAAGASQSAGFFGCYLAHHPEASSERDLVRVEETLRLPEARALERGGSRPAGSGAQTATLFSAAPLLETQGLDEPALRSHFPGRWRHEECDPQRQRLSFFCGEDRHVVLRAKELVVQRPHGQLLRTGRELTPAEAGLTSTVWMSGVFHSMVTQGHVNINRFLSTVRSYIGLFRAHGQRVFAEIDGAWQLLQLPSAFEMGVEGCRWIYRHAHGEIQVRAEARSDPHSLNLSIEVTAGAAMRFLIAHHIALNGDDGASAGALRWWREGEDILLAAEPGTDVGRRFPHGTFCLTPLAGVPLEQVGGDELLFLDQRSRSQPYLCIKTAPTRSAGLLIRGRLIVEETQSPLLAEPGVPLIPGLPLGVPSCAHGTRAAQLGEIAPWLTQNALVHYLSPRGLEQYSGGGWGTRDVCQGPIEMLLALDRIAPIRNVLLRLMAMQNPDGDWPQWFMFFERERQIRAGDSQGDIVLWPLVVLAQYLTASGDAALLDQPVRFFDARGVDEGECATVWEHAQRALSLTERRVIAGTCLPAYGHGDWNDSLQPADPRLREHLCSAWTVTLQVQALRSLAQALRSLGRAGDALPLERRAEAVQADFQRLLLIDGVIAGYALFEPSGVRYLLHPRDEATGIRYSSLAMIHAILESLLTPEQMLEQLRLLEQPLSGPDGSRLFDRPMSYHGGPQRLFQRAESATFFGREIGLMYTHAHLRYAQALAHVGEAERFFQALCLANPIGIRELVPQANLRQANCYFSSSDAAFADRYQASAEYARIVQGTIALDGGWRVYSSGAGIALGLIRRRFLGLSREAQVVRIDPVMPSALDRLSAQLSLLGAPTEVRYRIGARGCGVVSIELNGASLAFDREPNRYRSGAALVARAAVLERLRERGNVLQITLG